MTDTAVDFELEKMMQLLINSDNELILKTCYDKEKVVIIEKAQIEWLYEEMQFLRKFLKDLDEKRDEHEELKSLVAKIRDICYRIEDIIDWFLLNVVLQQRDGSTDYDFNLLIISSSEAQKISKSVTNAHQKICKRFQPLIKDIFAVNNCKTKIMGILSWLQSHMADKIGDGYHSVIEEMKPIIKEAMDILDNGSSLGWPTLPGEADHKDIDHPVACFHRFSRQKILEIDHLLNTSGKEIPDGFGCIIEEIKSIIEEVMEIYETETGLNHPMVGSSLCDKLASLYRLSIGKIGEIDHLLNSSCKQIDNGFGSIIEEIKSIIEEVMEIHEKESGRRWHASTPCELDRLYRLSSVFSDMDKIISDRPDWPRFGRLYRLSSEEMVDLVEKIPHFFDTIAEEIKSINTELMKICGKGLIITWINSDMTGKFLHLLTLSKEMVDLAEHISHTRGYVIKMTSIKREVMKIYQEGLRLSWLESLEGDKICKWFRIVTKEIKSIKREVMKIYDKKMYGIEVLQVEMSSPRPLSITTTFIAKDELVVGFDDETTTVMELLIEEHEKQLKVIPIIGMPGLGKTTLAIKVYNHPVIEYQFHFRAWTHVSQVYQRRDLLLSILGSANIQLKCNTEIMSDEELGEGLYKSLKGKKYLIVMDDIWELKAWDDLKRYFPNDNNRSRIIFTSRNVDVTSALHAKPHHLRFLNPDESWDLLRHKVFRGNSCPRELMKVGKQIAKKCRGLPLAIVVIAGLLSKKDKTQDWWSLVAESISSCIVTEPEQFMDTLALSYNHLPYHLKPCFLYFGAFLEDYEIPVWKLIWLWVAEGFIVQKQQKSLEEVAEDYMMDLIDRSLVVVSKRRSNGGIKACRVHDLLRDLCLRKAQEENFLLHVSRYEQTYSSSSSPMAKKQRRICISTCIEFSTIHTLINGCGYSKNGDPEVRSFSSTSELTLSSLLSFCSAFKLLRVLNISSVKISSFPKVLQLLVHLKYLSFHVDKEYFKPLVSNLWKLETFIVEGRPTGCVSFSHDIWKMVKLRHLCTKRFIEIPHVPNDDYPFVLDDLQTISKLDLCGVDEQVLRWIPNLRKLTCSFMESLGGDDIFPKLNFLIHLEYLNITYGGFKGHLGRFPHLVEFPPNLKSLALSNFRLSWEEMSTLGRLPNLEVLKLSYKAFEGPSWDPSDGLFCKLKFLRFQRLDIKQWNASSSQFPILQTLVLDDCKQLEQIPSGFADIFTLEMIRLWYCSSSAAHSALQIQKQQQNNGYDGLKIHIFPPKFVDDDEDIDDEDEDDAT